MAGCGDDTATTVISTTTTAETTTVEVSGLSEDDAQVLNMLVTSSPGGLAEICEALSKGYSREQAYQQGIGSAEQAHHRAGRAALRRRERAARRVLMADAADHELDGPKRQVAPGWYPDAHDEGQEQYWDGERWTDARRPVAAEPPAPKKSGPPAWLWIVGALLLIGIIAGAAGSGGEDSDSGGSSGRDEPTFTDPKVSGRCPGVMAAGVPDTATFRVTPQEDWPAVYVSLFSAEDIVDAVSMDGAPGKDIGMPSIETYRLAAGLDKGETGVVNLALLPIEAEKTELRVSIWGGGEREQTVGGGDLISTCELTVVP